MVHAKAVLVLLLVVLITFQFSVRMASALGMLQSATTTTVVLLARRGVMMVCVRGLVLVFHHATQRPPGVWMDLAVLIVLLLTVLMVALRTRFVVGTKAARRVVLPQPSRTQLPRCQMRAHFHGRTNAITGTVLFLRFIVQTSRKCKGHARLRHRFSVLITPAN
jgi:hypothetical protein